MCFKHTWYLQEWTQEGVGDWAKFPGIEYCLKCGAKQEVLFTNNMRSTLAGNFKVVDGVAVRDFYHQKIILTKVSKPSQKDRKKRADKLAATFNGETDDSLRIDK